MVDSSLSGVEVTLPQEFSALQLTKALHRKGLLKRKRHGHHQDDPETLLKKLIEELYSRNGNEHSIQELFIITKEMGIFFANLPPVSTNNELVIKFCVCWYIIIVMSIVYCRYLMSSISSSRDRPLHIHLLTQVYIHG